MQMREKQQMYGKVKIILRDEKKGMIVEREVSNAIVNKGRELVARLLVGETDVGVSPITHIAIGTDSTETNPTMVQLGAERSPRSVAVIQGVTMEGEEAQIDIEGTFKGEDILIGEETEVIVREAGLFTAISAGIMYNRIIFEEIPLRDSLELTLQWKLSFAPSTLPS